MLRNKVAQSNCCNFVSILAASEHPFKAIFSSLPKPGGGEFGKFYSLPALNDPRIGTDSCVIV